MQPADPAANKRWSGARKVGAGDTVICLENMTDNELFIAIHPAAPHKPALGAPCNGCGVCCAAEPCPVSRLLLGHRKGACPALQWQDAGRRYVCGMIIAPASFLRWLPQRWNEFASRRFARWIAADVACDADIEPL